MKDGYLSSLVGRAVQVYKGGPDSNVGKLLDVNGDYLTLQKEDGEIIYYKTSHVKSISENSKVRFNSALVSNLEGTDANTVTHELFKGENFTELALNLKDQKIRINGKGPESRVGHLIDVNDDFLVIYTKQDGLIFYKQQHIKSISQVIAAEEEVKEEDGEKDNNASSEEGNKEEELTAEVYEYMKNTYEQISAKNTNGLLTNLKLTWIKINRKGPESIEGMLVDANEDFLVLVVNNEVLRIATYHVKNFSVGVSVNKSDDQSKENADNQNSNNKNSNESNNDNQSQQTYAIPYRRRRTGGKQSNPREQYKNKNK